jgi:hypothetical protein
MTRILLCLLMLSSASLTIDAEEYDSNFSFGLKGSSLGVGVEISKAYREKLSFRLAYHFLDRSDEFEDGDTTYTGDLELSNGGLFADWHIFDGGFRVTGGLMLNNNEVTLIAKPTAGLSVDIGNTTYDVSGGEVNGKVNFNSFAPYLGMGWGKPVGISSKWAFLFDLGVMFQGTPDIDLRTAGTIRVGGIDVSTVPALQATLQTELDREIAKIEDDLDDFKLYPVLSLGVSYQF